MNVNVVCFFKTAKSKISDKWCLDRQTKKLDHTGSNGTKWDQLGPNGTKWDLMEPNWTKWDEMGQNGTKWDEMGQNGTKWDEMGRNGTKWNQTIPPKVLSNITCFFFSSQTRCCRQ